MKCLYFQDLIEEYVQDLPDNDVPDDGGVANVFFELANAPLVGYRISKTKKKEGSSNKDTATSSPTVMELQIRQDVGACGNHTGGIVWETSYLLLTYLQAIHETSSEKYPCGRVTVEVGAGCGLLGLGIYHASLARTVVLTETEEVLPNLQRNVEKNRYPSKGQKGESDDMREKRRTSRLHACTLDWTNVEEDCRKVTRTTKDCLLEAHSVDTIVGTDVVFSTRFVEPLLKTLRYLAHSKTKILLCLQERCKDSHAMLLDKASAHQLQVSDISREVTQVPGCQWGEELDCCILQFSVVEDAAGERKKGKMKNKRKRSRENAGSAL